MKKKYLKIGALVLALLLTIGVCLFANALVGNPISKRIATETAEKRLDAVYADTDYAIDRVSFSFKDSCYYAHIKSPTSIDGDFTLCISMTGKLKSDDYESRVTNHGNVANRLFFEYRELVDGVLESPIYPYTTSIAYGALEFEYERGTTSVEGSLSKPELENDRFYNVSEVAKKNGELVLFIDDETVNEEKAAEILLVTKRLMDDAGVSFYSVSFVLEYPPTDEKTYKRPEGRIRLDDFLYSDIYEEGMTERVRAAAK